MNIKEYIQELKNKRQDLSFAFLAERVPESADAPYRFNVAQPIRPDETLVLFLGGTGTNGRDNIRGYNGYAKQVDDFLKGHQELKDKSFRVCVAVCNMGRYHDADQARTEKMFQYIAPEQYQEFCESLQGIKREEMLNPMYIQDIFNQAVLPRISADNGRIRLSKAQALRNVRRLNIVTHCHGSYVALLMADMMQAKMRELGYSDKESKEIQKQLMVLNYAPDYPKGTNGARFINFESAADDHAQYQPMFKEWLQMKRKRFSLYYHNNWMMCGQIDKAGIEGNPPRVLIARRIDGDYFDEIAKAYQKAEADDLKEPEEDKTLGEHDFLGFEPKSNMSRAAIKLQKFFGNVLKNAVLNSCEQPVEGFTPLPSTKALLIDTAKEKLEIIKAWFTNFKLVEQFAHRNDKKLQQYMAWHQHSRITLG